MLFYIRHHAFFHSRFSGNPILWGFPFFYIFVLMLIALMDCNNFFVSCELTRRPELRGLPVVVGGRGDNGGCVVAMSNEAKAIGVTRGIPIFKIRDRIERNEIVSLPTDHNFYSSISIRVMNVLRSLDIPIEIYSVDEAFIHIPFSGDNATDFCRYIRETVLQQTGIPVSIGIATTKTLAKIAARFAKKFKGYNGVCLMDSPDKTAKALALTKVSDVWGIGRRLVSRLTQSGILTAADFAALPLDRVERIYNIQIVHTWKELNGEQCFDMESHQRKHLTISHTRTFERDIFDRSEIESRVAEYAVNIGSQLRKHHRLAAEIEVFVATNPYHKEAPQRHGSGRIALPDPSDDTILLAKVASQAFAIAYKEGYGYKRAGVIVRRAIDADHVQQSLFSDKAADERRRRLMNTLDSLNSSDNKVMLASTTRPRKEQ